jgi:hypothetical protein
VRLDTDNATNNTFDPHAYWTGFHAQDYGKAVALYQQLVSVLGNVVRELGQGRSAAITS